MKDESVLAVRIRENYSIFSKSEKKIADFLLANIAFCADATAKDIADRTDPRLPQPMIPMRASA